MTIPETALDELAAALQTAQRSTFRFEGHQDYPDDELWQTHLRGQWWEQSDDLADWCALVSANRDRGVTMTRVRLVTGQWTPYTRWEVEQHFPHNLRAGEDIRLLHVGTTWGRPDFYLVDDRRGWLLDYDQNGAMHVVAATDRALPLLRQWRDEALERATALSPATT